jgi:hypothetical protein
MSPKDIADLAERVKAATEGSRELAADICEALGFKVRRHSTTRFGRRAAAWAYLAPDRRWHAVEPILSSIDAALDLVEQRFPLLGGHFLELSIGQATHAELHSQTVFDPLGVADAPTPPLAIILALLRALTSIGANRAQG